MISSIDQRNLGVRVLDEERFERYAELNHSLCRFFGEHTEAENLEILRYFLLKGKFDYVNNTDEYGESPLAFAVDKNQLEVAELLLEHGADPNYIKVHGSILHLAVFSKRTRFIPTLLRYGADLNYQNIEDGSTALYIASFLGDLEIVTFLVSRGALLTRNFNGASPVAVACENGFLEIVEIFIRSGADINEVCLKAPLLGIAANYGHLNIVQFLLKSGAKIDLSEAGFTALHAACKRGHKEVVFYLLDQGADPNIEYGQNRTLPLYFAVENGYLAITERFFNPVELLTQFSRKGLLSIAARMGHKEILLYLLSKGLDINECSEVADSPLMVAAYKGNLEFAQILLAHGADINICSKSSGSTALEFAVKKLRYRMVMYLLTKGADPNRFNEITKASPLEIALDQEDLTMADLLVTCEADVNYRPLKSWTFLHLYVKKQKVNTVSFLLKSGAKIEVFDQKGQTPFHFACFEGNVEIINLFLQKGVDVNFLTKDKHLPVTCACYQGHVEVVDILWARGALMDWWQLVVLINAAPAKFSIEDVERWFDRLFDQSKDPNYIVKKVFPFPLPLISVLYLRSQSPQAPRHFAALYQRLLTKEGLILPEELREKVERPLILEDIGEEINQSLHSMKNWGRYWSNPWEISLLEVERVKIVKEYCKGRFLKEEHRIEFQKLVALYDRFVARHPLLFYLRLASKNFRETRGVIDETRQAPICIVVSLFNQYKLAEREDVKGHICKNLPHRKRMWKSVRESAIQHVLPVRELKELTFIHGTTTSAIPGLLKSRGLLPIGVLLDRGEVPFSGELCGSHRKTNKRHISGVTFPANGSTLQPQYYNLITGVQVTEFYATGGAAEFNKQGLFSLEEAFSHISKISIESLDQRSTDFLCIHIKRIKQFGHRGDPRMITLLEALSELPYSPLVREIFLAITEPCESVTQEEKAYIEKKAPVIFASSSARPRIRPDALRESLEADFLPLQKIKYAFTSSDQISLLSAALKDTGIEIGSLEKLRALSLFCMARGTWVESRISELSPIIGPVQSEITAILEGYILPNYAKKFPQRPSYIDRLGIRREITSPYFGERMTTYSEYESRVNFGISLPRTIHGLMHAVRVAIAAQMINNFLGREELPSWVIAACAAHDMGREDEAEDFWDEKSSQLFSSIMFIATEGSTHAETYGKIIADKDTRDPGLKTVFVEILHDSDVLEMHRIFLGNPTRFDKKHLYFLTNPTINPLDGEALISEWQEFVVLTEEAELKFRLEFEGRSYYLEVLQLLAKFVAVGKFPTIGRFLEKQLRHISTYGK